MNETPGIHNVESILFHEFFLVYYRCQYRSNTYDLVMIIMIRLSIRKNDPPSRTEELMALCIPVGTVHRIQIQVNADHHWLQVLLVVLRRTSQVGSFAGFAENGWRYLGFLQTPRRVRIDSFFCKPVMNLQYIG